MTTYVKILDQDGRSQNGGQMQWSLPVQNADGTWTPGEWHEVEGEIVPCKNGLHATTLEHRYAAWHKPDSEHYELEFDGDVIEHGSGTERKYVGRRARLLRHISHEKFWLKVREFVASLKDVRWFENHGDVQPHWDVYDARAAARAAAEDVAEVAMLSAAWSAAWFSAWSAARAAAEDVARAAARAAAEDVAEVVARAAAWSAAWSAAEDVALMAHCIVAEFDNDNPHYQHAVQRMEVRRAGYSLFCDYTDADGNVRFIVYKKP